MDLLAKFSAGIKISQSSDSKGEFSQLPLLGLLILVNLSQPYMILTDCFHHYLKVGKCCLIRPKADCVGSEYQKNYF